MNGSYMEWLCKHDVVIMKDNYDRTRTYHVCPQCLDCGSTFAKRISEALNGETVPMNDDSVTVSQVADATDADL